MVWAKIDDAILDNEKIVRAGALGFALHIAAIAYCCRNLTDGFILRTKARTLLDLEGLAIADGGSPHVDSYVEANADAIAEKNVSVGLWIWDEERTGWWLNDFNRYNPRRSQVLADRSELSKTRAESGRRGGQKSASKRRSKGEANDQANSNQNPSPDPGPDPHIPPTPEETPAVSGKGPFTASGAPLEAARMAFESTVAEAIQGPYALARSWPENRALIDLLNTHGPSSGMQDGLAWLRATIPRWVANVEPKYSGGWAPSKLLNWLNAKAPDRPSGAHATGGASHRSRKDLTGFKA